MRGAARGIGRRQRDLPAAFRPEHHQPAREAVGERLRERRQIRPRLEQRRGDEEQLDVGDRLARIALEERRDAARQVGREAGAEDEALGDAQSHAVEPHVPLERTALAAGIGNERGDVILQVLADAAQRQPSPRCRAPRARRDRRCRTASAVCGELIAPPARITSRSAARDLSSPALAGIRRRRRACPRSRRASPAPDLDGQIAAPTAPGADRRPRRCSAGRCGSSSACAQSPPAARRCSRRSTGMPGARGRRRR